MAAIQSGSQILFSLLLPIVMAMAGPLDYDLSNPCQCPTENETNLHLYLLQFPAWGNVTNPNEAPITVGGPPIGFGTTYVHDRILTEGPNPYEKIIGRHKASISKRVKAVPAGTLLTYLCSKMEGKKKFSHSSLIHGLVPAIFIPCFFYMFLPIMFNSTMVFDIRGIQVATDLYVEAFWCEMPLVERFFG
jgi:hypothetical protein